MRGGADGHDVLVVVPCLNEARHLATLLEQLARDLPAALIVVADGGSTDGSQAIVIDASLRHANILLLSNPRRIQSAGINLAVREHGAGRRWLVRIDAHCLYPPGYASRLVAAGDRMDVTSVVVPMVTRGETPFQRACATAQNSLLGTGGSSHRHVGRARLVDHGHHALMRIDSFIAVGGYDETMSHNEDAELDQRLLKAGGRIWLEPELAVTYFPRRTPAALWRQYHGYGRGRARTVAMHGLRLKLRQMLPLAVPLAVLLALLWPVSLAFLVPLVAWAVLCLGFGVFLGLRARSAPALLSGFAAMVMHLAWGSGFVRERLNRTAGRRRTG